MTQNSEKTWFEDYAECADEIQIDEYDITSTPNDFNLLTLNSFVEAGAVRIPGFQRNFVWDHARASKLIESLILGLPVPQLFLYEQSRNRFLVIDGQQRLMTIYYFIKKRFPKKDKRVELRSIFDREGKIPDDILYNNEYFDEFNLRLSGNYPNKINKFNKLNYSTLGEYKTQFDLRPLRNIVVKQNSPTDDDSSMYEVFNRLNTGGVNLRPQEIRTSMYHSKFYNMLYRINQNQKWRLLLQSAEPDIHMKDIEIILRGYAMLIDGDSYSPSMLQFLNKFSKKCETHSDEKNAFLERIFLGFLESCQNLPSNAFLNKKSNRFNIALFEAAFTAVCRIGFLDRTEVVGVIDPDSLRELEDDKLFTDAAIEGTTRTLNVENRLSRAKALIRINAY